MTKNNTKKKYTKKSVKFQRWQIFNRFNLIYMGVIACVGLGAVMALHPRRDPVTFSDEQLRVMLPTPPELPEESDTPAAQI